MVCLELDAFNLHCMGNFSKNRLHLIKLKPLFLPNGQTLAKYSFLIFPMISFYLVLLSTGYTASHHGRSLVRKWHNFVAFTLETFLQTFLRETPHAAIWVQFHNLPVEFWEGETLETIAGQLGTLIKIDEFTSNLVRSKYARVCINIDLSKPLCHGF